MKKLGFLIFLFAFLVPAAVFAESQPQAGSCALRKKVAGLVTVYKICSFQPKEQMANWAKAFEPDSTHSFVLNLNFLYDVGGYRGARSFARAMPKSIQTTPEAKSFFDFVNALTLNTGAQMNINFGFNEATNSWLQVVVTEAGEQKNYQIASQQLSQALASIWLGDNPIDEEIKNKLLGLRL